MTQKLGLVLTKFVGCEIKEGEKKKKKTYHIRNKYIFRSLKRNPTVKDAFHVRLVVGLNYVTSLIVGAGLTFLGSS